MEAFDYFAPRSVTEVYQYLGNGKTTLMLAGGTDVIVQLREGRRRCDQLVAAPPAFAELDDHVRPACEHQRRLAVAKVLVNLGDRPRSEVVECFHAPSFVRAGIAICRARRPSRHAALGVASSATTRASCPACPGVCR